MPPGPRRFLTKVCLRGTWQGAFSQQREVFSRPRKGELSCCFLLPHLRLRGGKSNISTECWANPFSPLSSLWKQLLYGKDRALTVITPAHLSFVSVAGEEGTCVSTGRDQFIRGVVDQRWVCEQQPEAGTRVGSTVLPSAGATPLVRGSGSGVKEETKPGEKKVSVIFPRLLQLLSTSVIPSKAKAALWMQAAPFTLRGTAHSPGSAVRAGNRWRSRAMVMWLLTRAQWSTTSSDTGPAQTGVTHVILLHITSRGTWFWHCAPLSLHPIYSITYTFKQTFPLWAFAPPSAT